MLRGSLPRQGLSSLVFGNAVGRWWDLRALEAGLATIIPNTFAAAGNIEGSAPGPSLAVVTTLAMLASFRSAPDRVCRAAFDHSRCVWILVV